MLRWLRKADDNFVSILYFHSSWDVRVYSRVVNPAKHGILTISYADHVKR